MTKQATKVDVFIGAAFRRRRLFKKPLPRRIYLNVLDPFAQDAFIHSENLSIPRTCMGLARHLGNKLMKGWKALYPAQWMAKHKPYLIDRVLKKINFQLPAKERKIALDRIEEVMPLKAKRNTMMRIRLPHLVGMHLGDPLKQCYEN